MNTSYLRDQRGVAMLMELALVAVVLSLVGLAVYQATQHPKNASVSTSPAAATAGSAAGLAASAAAVVQTEPAADASLSASADATASEVSATDNDVASLGDSINANSF